MPDGIADPSVLVPHLDYPCVHYQFDLSTIHQSSVMLTVGLLMGVLVGAMGYPATWPASQYHAQDPSGSYRYGYSSPHQAKMESRANGVTQGGYSYIDANGILQTVAYTADDVNGFRILASNLPQQVENSLIRSDDESKSPGVRRKHLADNDKYENSIIDNESDSEMRVNPFLLSPSEAASIKVPRPHLISNIKETSPLVNYSPVNPQPSAYAPIVPWRLTHSALHHTQDSLGQYDYSYAGDTSAKTESRSLDGTTRGAYSYIDANGLLQQVHYIADHNGFRVLATNLPEA
ncbi:uncharacterized protein [Fopius arisanus]|uniref:CUO6_0 protein n=1 Tax=Fopius arisanus TaxID=64838 RepID=A0A0C9PJL9_9HYME|nr:PREDICTED: uncharacterized protein LOC105266730 [Fopius arisanus]